MTWTIKLWLQTLSPKRIILSICQASVERVESLKALTANAIQTGQLPWEYITGWWLFGPTKIPAWFLKLGQAVENISSLACFLSLQTVITWLLKDALIFSFMSDSSHLQKCTLSSFSSDTHINFCYGVWQRTVGLLLQQLCYQTVN
jgi:hypothetical protein